MFYADTVGLPYIRDRLAALAKTSGDKRHEPAALLSRLAAENSSFGAAQKKAA
jgi:3-hydroxyacyl-CoA dehydrogenase